MRLVSAETETVMVQKTILRQDCLPFVFFVGTVLSPTSISDLICVVSLCSVEGGSPLSSVVFIIFLYSIEFVARPRCKRAIFTYIHTYIQYT